MKTVIAKGRHVMGKLSRNCDKTAPRNCEAALTWELRQEGDKLEFSACGEVWNHLKTDIVCGGQCVDTLADLFPRDKLAQRIREVWSKYHLNGMNAGTPEQSAFVATLPEDVRRDYGKVCEALDAAGLLSVPVTDELRASALGGLPAGAKVYKYGSRWLYFAIPDDVVALVKRGFQDWKPADDTAPGGDVNAEILAADPEESGEPERDLIADAGLTVRAVFIPWSKSRNSREKMPSLNWRVTLEHKGREVFSFDYSAGSAHCPAYRKRFKGAINPTAEKADAIRKECERGREYTGWAGGCNGKPIEPDARQVISAILHDCGALDAGCFPDWCAEYGFDADSIKARKTYDECIAQAVALRAAVGPAMFAALREANA